MALFVHRGSDTTVLAEGLAELLASPLEDPFAEEVVAVPARGVERWLAQRLSHRLGVGERGGDGVCAGVRFLSPHSLIGLLLGTDRDDPWHPDQLAWPVLAAIDASLDEPWASSLATHLGHGVAGEDGELRRGRRYSVARRLAGLFSSYAAQRPAMVADWRTGGAGDGLGEPVATDLAWQPELWRRVLERVDADPPEVRLAQTVAALTGSSTGNSTVAPTPEGLVLPSRLSLFGHTRLNHSEVQLVAALGEQRDVHLWLPQASPTLWERLAPVVAAGPVPRDEDRSVDQVAHPLLAALGRDAREVQRSLAAPGAAAGTHDVVDASPDAQHPSTMLHWLQHDLRHAEAPDAATVAARTISPEDRSVQVHATHGPARQIEVLREVLLGLLADDATLEPRDVLVMCPDVDTYAPLVTAAFGLADAADAAEASGRAGGASRAHPGHRLRVLLADRAPRHTNPMLGLAAALVRLAGGRATASEVLDLARSEPVRRRFGWAEDDLDRLGEWTEEAVVRWGLDQPHRERYRLQAISQNTWRAGLDRLLVGLAVDGEALRRVGTALAVDGLEGGDLELVGRLAELLERLTQAVTALRACATPTEWASALEHAVRSIGDTRPEDGWQLAQLERELAGIGAVTSGDPHGTTLSLSDVAALLDDHLAGRPTRANFRTGTLTVCTLVPMRSVPHRVVCLLGLDDDAFPRSPTVDGDDLLARRPVTGERDARAEDRQLLLDAVLSAREHLVLTYTGADEHTGAARSPAVPLGELIDTLHRTASLPPGHELVVHHPLQPYDARNLGGPRPPTGSDGRPFSFDRAALDGAVAAAGERHEPLRLTDRLPPAPGAERDIDLDDLVRLLTAPAREFLFQRLEVRLPRVSETTRDGIPIDVAGLARWRIGDRVLRDVLAGRSLEQAKADELLRGELPPDAIGQEELATMTRDVQRLAERGSALRREPAREVDVTLDLGGHRLLAGTVAQLHGPAVVEVSYSSVRARHRLAAWVRLLALTAAHPGTDWTSHVLGGRGRYARHVTLGPVPPDQAMAWLRELVELYDRGLREPLPVPVETAYAYVTAEAGQERRRADAEWQTQDRPGAVPGEREAPEHVRVYGQGASVDLLLHPAGQDEQWTPGEPARLGQLARRIWVPAMSAMWTAGL